jgi:peptidyl-prolyl cis-trans isomerase C
MKAMRFLVVGVLLALAACSKPAATDKPADTAATPARPPLVTVNGAPVSSELYEAYVQAVAQGKPSSELPPEAHAQIREELVRMELVAQQAEKDGLARDPEVASRLELTRLNVLQQALAQKYLKSITEAELRAEFDTQLAATPLVEYHARHILVSSADTAQKIIDQLKKGGDFATLAKRYSGDKGSAAKGGDLDWFPPNVMAKEFSDAIGLLKNGEVAPAPVQTKYGWHVIQLLGSRDRPAPTFEAVQDDLKRIVLGKKFRANSDAMLKTAKVDPPLASATPAPAAPTPEPAPVAPAKPAN